MAQRYWYAYIVTENNGSWYGRFTSKRKRDDFCNAGGVWLTRDNQTGAREFVKARIIPTTTNAMRANMSKSVKIYY